jgi:hypothetical protein
MLIDKYHSINYSVYIYASYSKPLAMKRELHGQQKPTNLAPENMHQERVLYWRDIFNETTKLFDLTKKLQPKHPCMFSNQTRKERLLDNQTKPNYASNAME